jgi:hypothetical protein
VPQVTSREVESQYGLFAGLKGSAVMDDLLELDLELDEQNLTINIPDEALERAATVEQQAIT